MKTVGGSSNHLKWIERVLTNPKACHWAIAKAKEKAVEYGIDISKFSNVRRFPR